MKSHQQSDDSAAVSAGDEDPRQRIVAAARRHYLAHGFRGVTMDDLALELAMSKKTIYAHFAGKRELVAAVIDEKMNAVDADLESVATDSESDFAGALKKLLSSARRQAEELQPPFLRDLARETPELFGFIQERRRQIFRKHFGKLLSEGRKAGMVRGDLGIDLMIEILIGTADAVMNPDKLSQLGISAKTCLSGILTVFLQGIVTEKEP